jgi:hypothetical protein
MKIRFLEETMYDIAYEEIGLYLRALSQQHDDALLMSFSCIMGVTWGVVCRIEAATGEQVVHYHVCGIGTGCEDDRYIFRSSHFCTTESQQDPDSY